MLSADVDRVVVRPYDTTSLNEPLSPLPSTSLTRAHLSDAFAQSPDKGATLDLAHKGFTDVSGFGAEEPAAAGSEDPLQDESSVVRCVVQGRSCVRPGPSHTSCITASPSVSIA
jgi:hypothetical protein